MKIYNIRSFRGRGKNNIKEQNEKKINYMVKITW